MAVLCSFVGTAYMNVGPGLDVAKVQQVIHTALRPTFKDPSGPVKVQVFAINTQITPIGRISHRGVNCYHDNRS